MSGSRRHGVRPLRSHGPLIGLTRLHPAMAQSAHVPGTVWHGRNSSGFSANAPNHNDSLSFDGRNTAQRARDAGELGHQRLAGGLVRHVLALQFGASYTMVCPSPQGPAIESVARIGICFGYLTASSFYFAATRRNLHAFIETDSTSVMRRRTCSHLQRYNGLRLEC